METRYSTHPNQVKDFSTAELRENYLIEELFVSNETKLVYSMDDRIIIGGITPKDTQILLEGTDQMQSEYFLDRREVGIFNVGGKGKIVVDGETFDMENKDCLYVGLGKKELVFSSESSGHAAKYYIFSAPAHKEYPVQHVSFRSIEGDRLGTVNNANQRVIRRFIHEEGIQSCQIVMGMTQLDKGSVWNSVPTHTHDRRTEVYLYIDLDEDARLFHFMGESRNTKHVILKNEQAVISPPWSIHCGTATSNYAFVWGMAGDNKTISDAIPVKLEEMR